MNLTHVSKRQPWGFFSPHGHRVLCSDGRVRAARMALTADTFFSVPASVRVRGKHVSGFVTTKDHGSECIYCFHQHTDTTSGALLPPWPASYEDAHDALLAKALREEAMP